MDQLHASRTAIRVAVLRAAHQLLDGEPRILIDPVGVGLVPEASERALRANTRQLQQPSIRRLRANFVLRSRFAEDCLEAPARRGITLYVLLGAGLGSEMVLIYIADDWASLDADDRMAMEGAEARAAGSGEPWLSKFSARSIADLLSPSGFSRIEPLSIDDAKKRYFRNRDDKLQPSGGTGLVPCWAPRAARQLLVDLPPALSRS